LRDQFQLSSMDIALPRYYVIEDVGRASEGFSATWYPHLYRLKLKKLTDSQQFADIFNKPALDSMGNPDEAGTTLKDLLSTYTKELAVNDALVAEAELDAPKSGYETRQFYTLEIDPNTGRTVLQTTDTSTIDASSDSAALNASAVEALPTRSGYTGYLIGDGATGTNSNAAYFGHGIQFPADPVTNDFFLRTDFMPNRLFKFNGTSWIKYEDNVRMTMTNNDTRQTLKTSFINNTNTNVIAGETIVERQALSKALKPKADL